MANDIKSFISEEGLMMDFANGGRIRITRQSGAFVIASGCGSGKTTIIKEIIRQDRGNGVLYAAATIKECNEMYEYCKSLYESLGKSDKLKDEVIVLHSDYRSEGVDNNSWRNNPLSIQDKLVVICTHHKLLNSDPTLLIRYNHRQLNINNDLNIFRRANMVYTGSSEVANYPREYILIDEMPTCDSLNIKVSRAVILLLGSYLGYLAEDRKTFIVIDENRYICGLNRMRNIYYNIIPKNLQPIKPTDELNKIMIEVLLSIIMSNYDEYANSDEDFIDISYNISDLVSDVVNSKYILFDGTGDLTFVNSERFKVLTFDNKYSGNIGIEIIRSNMNRYVKPTDYDEETLLAKLRENVNMLVDIVNRSDNGTLIVTWKNLKSDEYKVSKNGINVTCTALDDSFSLPDYYRRMIYGAGVTKPFEIIHYQSGLDKATNEFRDYDQIVFLGEFHVPNHVIAKFNEQYKCKTNPSNYLTYQLVQAVCRTRIRKHTGESIKIYFTKDWSSNAINNLVDYIKSDKIKEVKPLDSTALDGIKPKWVENTRILMNYSKEFRSLIEHHESGDIEFTLDELSELIPMKVRRVQSYYSMMNYYKKLGINMIVTSEWGRNQFTKYS